LIVAPIAGRKVPPSRDVEVERRASTLISTESRAPRETRSRGRTPSTALPTRAAPLSTAFDEQWAFALSNFDGTTLGSDTTHAQPANFLILRRLLGPLGGIAGGIGTGARTGKLALVHDQIFGADRLASKIGL
jgi:hypothetical protein